MSKRDGARWRCVVFIICALLIIVLLGLVIWLAGRNTEVVKEIPYREPLVGYIQPNAIRTGDGINVKWYPRATSRADVERAAAESFDMVEVSITHASNQDSTIAIDNIWSVLQTNDIGVKINVGTNDEAEKLINDLKARVLKQPILLSVELLDPNQDFNWQIFTQTLSDTTFNSPVAINIKVSPACCKHSGLGHGVVEYLGFLVKNSNFSMTVEFDAELIQSSWADIKWLLDTNPNLQLILSTTPMYNVTKYDLLLVQNDINSDQIFFNIDGELYRDFLDLATTAGSPLLYFGITPRDASKIRWSHNTDTWELLNAATQGDVMMIEGDIMLQGQDTEQQTQTPIMAHTVGDDNNLTFEEWVDEIIKVDKGMKLDFKTIDAVKPALEIVQKKKAQIKGPVWANADILKGPNGKEPRQTASAFIDAVSTFPNVVLSLGWTTVAKKERYNLNYTMSMVQEMYDTVKDLSLPITYPIRAEQLVDSWSALEWLLGKSRGYTLTVWTAEHDNVTKADMDFIRRKTEASRIYFDLPVDLRPTLY